MDLAPRSCKEVSVQFTDKARQRHIDTDTDTDTDQGHAKCGWVGKVCVDGWVNPCMRLGIQKAPKMDEQQQQQQHLGTVFEQEQERGTETQRERERVHG